eukprot:8161355-Alexandrium_andersonii.AAC.1
MARTRSLNDSGQRSQHRGVPTEDAAAAMRARDFAVAPLHCLEKRRCPPHIDRGPADAQETARSRSMRML